MGWTGSIQAQGGPPPIGQAPPSHTLLGAVVLTRQVPLLLGMLGNVWKQMLLAFRWEPGMLLNSQLHGTVLRAKSKPVPVPAVPGGKPYPPPGASASASPTKWECQEATLTAAVRGETFHVKEA